MAGGKLIFDGSTIDTAIDQIIAHEKTITDNENNKVFGDKVCRWRGIPKQPSMRPGENCYLWIWQGRPAFKKKTTNNLWAEGNCDLIFIIAQYIDKYDDGSLREDILQQRNGLVKKFGASLIDSVHVDITKDAMTYPSDGSWYFISGDNVVDTEDFYYGGISQVFPLTGKPVPENWYLSVVTSTIYFNNRK